MARIVYAVAGEGFGHSSRSHIISKRLIDSGHDVIFAASNKSLVYLKQYFGERVKEVFGLSFDYHQGRVSAVKTILSNVWRTHKGLRQPLKMSLRGAKRRSNLCYQLKN